MKNVTITLDEKTAAWARIYAAQRGKSVSRLLGEILQERMRELREAEKQPIAAQWIERLWREQLGRVSIQVLNECYATLNYFFAPLRLNNAIT